MTDHEEPEWDVVVGRWLIPVGRWEEIREYPETVDTLGHNERCAIAHVWIEDNRRTARRMAVVRSAHCPTTGRYPTIAGVYEVPRIGPCLSMAVDKWELYDALDTFEDLSSHEIGHPSGMGRRYALPDRLVVLADDDRETIPINCPTCWSALTLRRHDLDAVVAEYHRTGKASRVLTVAD